MIKTQEGFTLIEMMIAVTIVGILVAIAYPSYDENVKRGNRSEGLALLNDVAARQERHFAQNNIYITATTDADITKLGMSSKESPTGKYTLSISSVANDGGYTLTAMQAFGDLKCGNLTLNALGAKGKTGTKTIDDCWR